MAAKAAKSTEIDVSIELPSVEISIPVATGNAEGYEAQQIASGHLSLDDDRRLHVDIMLGAPEASAFIKIRTALRAQQAKLNDGRPVWNNNDVLRWIFQQVNAKFEF